MTTALPPRYPMLIALILAVACGRVTSVDELIDASDEPTDASPDESDACVESDEAFCQRAGSCLEVTALDRCGEERTVACSCYTPGDVCGGGGEAGVCAAHPELDGIGGYIHHNANDDLAIHRAEDGVLSVGGQCCSPSVEEARKTYPDRSLIYLPEASPEDFTEGVIPALIGVDGYIVPIGDSLRIELAKDGAMIGEDPLCCYDTVEIARSENPDLNLAALTP